MNSFCELVLSFNLKIIFHIVLSVYTYQYARVWKKYMLSYIPAAKFHFYGDISLKFASFLFTVFCRHLCLVMDHDW